MGGQIAGRGVLTPERQAQITAFLGAAGWGDAPRTTVAGDASNRRYDRLRKKAGETAILMDAPPEKDEDTRPFIAIADHLRKGGLSAPAIYHQNTAQGLLLIEDFGDDVFARLIRDDPAQQGPLYRAACDVLLTLRNVTPPKLTECDADWLTDMTSLAFEWYTQAPEKAQFAQIFRPLAKRVANQPMILMLRDYHVENLMLLPDRPGVARVGLLDFQDAMCAHPAYDLVSILQDARRDVSEAVEREMLDYYLSHVDDDPTAFKEHYAILGLQRNLRIMGVFARLSLRDGKPHYVDMIPRVWSYVQRNLAHPALGPLAPLVSSALPTPTPQYLERLKNR